MKRDPLGKRLADCQRAIGYWFADPDLLETALTHSSLRSPDRACNERLEFLGDSVLGLVVTEELFHLLPEHSEGELTRIKSAVVSRPALLATSMRLGLPDYADFARGVGRRDRLPPSVIANLVESVIGSIYLDAGFDAAREFVLRHLGETLERELGDEGVKNHKSLLQHEIQQAINITPAYRTIEEEGPDHRKSFVVAVFIGDREWGRAPGGTKKEAEQEAARQALEAWRARELGDAEDPLEREPSREPEEVFDATPEAEPTEQAEASAEDTGEEAAGRRRRRRGRRGRVREDAPAALDAPAAMEAAEHVADEDTAEEVSEDTPEEVTEHTAEDEPQAAPSAAPILLDPAATFDLLLEVQRQRTPRRRGQHRPTPEAAKALFQEDPDNARMRRRPPEEPRAPREGARPEPAPAPVAAPASPPTPVEPAKPEPAPDDFAAGLFEESRKAKAKPAAKARSAAREEASVEQAKPRRARRRRDPGADEGEAPQQPPENAPPASGEAPAPAAREDDDFSAGIV
ncbi:MAG: ribonuclease III [Planctomycetota bacterium]